MAWVVLAQSITIGRVLSCEGLYPEQQLANYQRRIANDYESEWRENSVEEFKVIARRLRLCLLDEDPTTVARWAQ